MTTANEYYEQGNHYRRMGIFHSAMNCYSKAIELDPSSPAATARQMLTEQYAFFHKDYYNP